MSFRRLKMFNDIYEDMMNGNWSTAIAKFNKINPTPREFQDFLEEVEDKEELRDWALLGFYCRDYNG
jgi:adenylosuccinate synthase